MSGLQLYLRNEEKRDNTVIDLYLKYGESHAMKSSIMLTDYDKDEGLARLNIRELGVDRKVAVYHDQEFTVDVNDADITHKVTCTVFWHEYEEKVFISIDADKDNVYIGKHKHGY